MVSKALEDVWKWREAVCRDTKDMTVQEQRAYYARARRELEERTGIKLNLPRRERKPKSR